MSESSFICALLLDPKETLEEALDALENRRSDGVLLDAYVAGSSLQNFIKTPYRVRRVIETSKGMGVVLSGDAVVLRFRVRDFIKKNAKRITKIIENSTTPVKVRAWLISVSSFETRL